MSAANEYLAGYIEEVRTYIPTLRENLGILAQSPQRHDLLEEVYRLAHIIKGASSMVGVQGLSQIAGAMEGHLESIVEHHGEPSEEAIAVMLTTVDKIASYCNDMGVNDSANEQLVTDALNDFSTLQPHTAITTKKPTTNTTLPTDGMTVEQLDADLLNDFRTEANEHFEEMYHLLGDISTHVAELCPIDHQIRDQLQQLRRPIHTLKGAAAVVGLEEIAAYSHRLEDILDWLYERADHIDPLLMLDLDNSLDQLVLLVDERDRFEPQRAQSILDALYQRMQSDQYQSQNPAMPTAEPAFAATAMPQQSTSSTATISSSLFSDEDRAFLLEGFQEEAEEHLQQLHHSMSVLEQQVSKNAVMTNQQRDEVRSIRRAVHTIKGAAAVIGLSQIAEYSHGIEDFLDWLYEQSNDISPQLIAPLQTALDYVAGLVEQPDRVSQDSLKTIQQRLQMLQAGVTEEEQVVVEETEEQIPETAEDPIEAEVADLEPLVEEPASQPLAAQQPIEAASAPRAAAPEAVPTLRVAQSQIDTLVNLANELLVGISGFDRNMERFREAISELDLATSRIKDIALELETNFEVKALTELDQRFSRVEQALADIRDDSLEDEEFKDFDAMELDRYSQLNLVIRSLNESAIDVSAIRGTMETVHSGLGGDINRQRRVVRELQVQVLRARMSPMSSIVPRLSRTVRDVASRLDKQVRIQVEGEGVELDRMVWEKLADPLMHLVRNAIHHGIESAVERDAAGKNAIAQVKLSGRREGNNIVIRFSDDGRGLDFDAIRAKASTIGLGEDITEMNERQLTEFIFYPGFSTKTISEISGRGVGMDVVRENLKELQGSVSVETTAGKGTTFIMRVPLSMGVVRCLLVNNEQTTYGIPLNDIKEIRRIDTADIDQNKGIIRHDGEEMPWYAIGSLLGISALNDDTSQPLALMIEAEGKSTVLTIPGTPGQNELVVKDLGSQLGSVPGVSGAAVMGDGSVVPILDIDGLIRSSRISEEAVQLREQIETEKRFSVMIVDDSISIRRVMSRLVSAQGWEPIEARDGLEALALMEALTPDCILLDIEMPRMNGFEFLIKRENMPQFRQIPVVMLTSRTSDKHREKAFALGAQAFLNKPCKDEDFVKTVVNLTGAGVTAEAIQ